MTIPAVFFCLAFRALPLPALDLSVGLYNDEMIRSVLLSVVEGRFRVTLEGGDARAGIPGDSWYITFREDSLYTRGPAGDWRHVRGMEMLPLDEGSVFSIKPAYPVLDAREYFGALQIGVGMKSIQLVNNIDLETYIKGVVETEAGPSCPLEYYKVQAILCRTFALRNLERHTDEGFNLCDAVHCQSYKGRHIWSEDVEIGTEVTDGLVLSIDDSTLINPVYHSNSGGETRGAEKVWLKSESYLRPVLDPFSVGKKNAGWERRISMRDWSNYLKSYGIRVPDDAEDTEFEMRLKHRRDYYRVFGDSIPVLSIREDFKYRSDYFDVIAEEGMILIRGRGYGHGVGLSQEGAIEMAKRRYHYTAILNYYYHGIRIVPYFDLKPLFSH
jgi:stage II sporulation protein D